MAITLEERYESNKTFRRLVDDFEARLRSRDVTASNMRDALSLAAERVRRSEEPSMRQRDAMLLAWASEGKTFKWIGAKVGVSAARASADVQAARRRVEIEQEQTELRAQGLTLSDGFDKLGCFVDRHTLHKVSCSVYSSDATRPYDNPTIADVVAWIGSGEAKDRLSARPLARLKGVLESFGFAT